MNIMLVHLPNSAFLGNIDFFLKNLDLSNPELLKVTSNKKWLSLHPVVLSMVASLGFKLGADKIECEEFTAASKNYIIRMGLLRILGVQADVSFVEHEPAGRFIPITQIRTSTELSAFITDMIPLLHLEREQAQTIGYIVSELVRNVIEHADSETGAIICAQYYKKSNSIRVGIADTGRGIKYTITRSHRANTDMDAIRLALRPGITGTTRKEGGTEQNAGAGLFFIKSIASVNRDFFIIYSGNAFFKLLKKPANMNPLLLRADPLFDRHSKIIDLPYWQGTVVGVDITLDQTQVFSQLLRAIRDAYSKDVKERKKAKYKTPRFE
jgi:anti-sigma regulatory factor (Ser/Thr protein kinase)